MSDTRISCEDRSRRDLKAAYRMASLICVVMIISLFVYAAVVEFLINVPPGGFSGMGAETLVTVRSVLLTAAAATFFVIRFLRKKLLSGSAHTAAAPAGRLLTASIVVYALCESVVIYGLVLYVLCGDPSDFYLFMGISLLYFAVSFPRLRQWEEWTEGLRKAESAGRR